MNANDCQMLIVITAHYILTTHGCGFMTCIEKSKIMGLHFNLHNFRCYKVSSCICRKVSDRCIGVGALLVGLVGGDDLGMQVVCDLVNYSWRIRLWFLQQAKLVGESILDDCPVFSVRVVAAELVQCTALACFGQLFQSDRFGAWALPRQTNAHFYHSRAA